MEWLIAHEDELEAESSRQQESSLAAVSSQPAVGGPPKSDVVKKQTVQQASTVKPSTANNDITASDKDEHGEETAQAMASRKKMTVEEAQKIINERLFVRAEEERKRAIEDEKKRRLDGQKMAQTRQELQDQERIRLAQQIRQEKIEKEAHRKRVLEQIARDREAMKAKADGLALAGAAASSASKPPSKDATSNGANKPREPAKECRVALRFPDGSNIVQKFASHDNLSAVRSFVQTTKDTRMPVSFVAPPNKKLTDSMMNYTLEDLGLCPASRLEVNYQAHDAWTNDVELLD